jgi:hypothetical protein
MDMGEEFRVSSFGFQVLSFVGTTPLHGSRVSFVDIMRSGVVGRMGHAPEERSAAFKSAGSLTLTTFHVTDAPNAPFRKARETGTEV